MALLDFLNRFQLDKKKVILIMLGFFILIVADFNFIIIPQFKAIASLGSKVLKVKKDLAGLEKELAAAGNSVKAVKVVSEKKVILEKELPYLLINISNLANANNIKVMQINSSKESGAFKDNITRINIKLDVICTYHNLGAFINKIENSEQIMHVQEFRINRDSADNLKQKVNLTIKAYAKK